MSVAVHHPRRLSVQYTQDVRGCPPAHIGRPWLSVCVHVCPSAHTGRPLLSISTHISTLALPVDCSGDFGPRGLSVQYTQDVRVCPSAHTRRSCLSVCVRVCPSAHTGHLWLSISTHINRLVLGLSTLTLPVDCSGDFGPRGLSVQYTQDVRGCPSAHTERPWLSISTHISTLVLGLSTLTLPVDCSGDFGPRGLSVQYTHDVRGTLTLPVDSSGDIGPRGLSVQYTQDVRGCPAAHIGRLWLSVCPCVSVCTHRTSVAVHQLFVQYTHDVRGCPSAHRGRPCVSVSTHRTSVAVCVCPCVSVSTQRTSVAVHQYTYQQVGPWTQHADHSRGLFGTHRTSVAVHQKIYQHIGPFTQHADPSRGQLGTHRTSLAVHHTHRTSVGVRQHAQDVRVCPSVHTGCPWLFVCVRVCPSAHTGRPWLSIITHIGRLVLGLSTLTLPVDCSAHTGRPWLSISTHISTLVLGLSTLTLPVDCFGDFSPRGLSVQYTQNVRGCPSAHTGHPCVSVSTHKTSVAVCVCPSAHTRRPWLPISTHISWLVLGLSTPTLPVECSGDFGPRGLSVQYTQNVRGCPSAHTRRPWLSVCVRHRTFVAVHHTQMTSVGVRQHTYDVRGCRLAHTGRPWLTVCPTLTLLVDISGDFGPRGLSVQYTQDVCGCPPAHTGRPCVSISTHISTLTLPVDCLGDFGPRGLFVQYTQDVRGCSSAHTGRMCVSVSTHRTSVAVCVCPSAHTGRPTHRMSVGVRQHTRDVRVCPTLTLLVDSSSDFGPRVLSVQYTQDVRGTSMAVHQYTKDVCGCPSEHISAHCTHRTSVGVRQHTQDVHVCPSAHTRHPWLSVCVRVCPSAHTGHPWLSISTHIRRLVLGLSPLTLPVDCSGDFGPRGLSVQYTQDVRGCPSAHTGRLWLSMCVCVCPSAHTGRPWLSISTHISTLALPVDCFGDFSPRGLVVQYTQDVRGCPSAHTERPCVSVSTHRTSVAVCVCPCVSVSTHRTFVAVHQYTYQQVGPWTQHADPSRGLFG
ncbi:hypothetical protein YC2023_066341 [Brassica napus]